MRSRMRLSGVLGLGGGRGVGGSAPSMMGTRGAHLKHVPAGPGGAATVAAARGRRASRAASKSVRAGATRWGTISGGACMRGGDVELER